MNLESHWSHFQGLNPRCVFSWRARLPLVVKAESHSLQWYGFSPVWHLVCTKTNSIKGYFFLYQKPSYENMLTNKIVPRGKFAAALFALKWFCVTWLVRLWCKFENMLRVDFQLLLEKIHLLSGSWCWISCRRIHKSELHRCLVQQLQRTLASLCSESQPSNLQVFLDCNNLLNFSIWGKIKKKSVEPFDFWDKKSW